MILLPRSISSMLSDLKLGLVCQSNMYNKSNMHTYTVFN